MRLKRLFCCFCMLLALDVIVNASTVAGYDASAVTNLTPAGVTPAWTAAGDTDAVYVLDAGDYLRMNLGGKANQQYCTWTSPASQTVSMIKGNGEYGIQVRVQPNGDITSTGDSYAYAQFVLRWSDDCDEYLVSFDKDSDDGSAGTTGRVACGKYPLVTVFDGVDWSIPHAITIDYYGGADTFFFYLDGVYKANLSGSALRVGGTDSSVASRIQFGDTTTGGSDCDARWYFVKLSGSPYGPVHDVAKYDAFEVTGLTPAGVTPAWTAAGDTDAAYVLDDGDYLLMNLSGKAGQQYCTWASPSSQNVSMVKGHGEYGIQVRVQPNGDIASTGDSYAYAQVVLRWSDDCNEFLVSFDKDSDDGSAGTTGGVNFGKYPMKTAIAGIDWSIPHTITISYYGSDNAFYFYVDDEYRIRAERKDIQVGAYSGTIQNRVQFGDTTTGGSDCSVRWYNVRLCNNEIRSRFYKSIALYSGVNESELDTFNFINECVENGINTFVTSVSSASYVLWDTDKAIYLPAYQTLLNNGYDALAQQIRYAHAMGANVIPTVAVYPSQPIGQQNSLWITKNAGGTSSSEYALAFSYSGARQEKIELLMDLVLDYDIDGIMLDYCRYPDPNYGFDQPIVDECISTYGFNPRNGMNSTQYAQFAEVRADSVTMFVGEIYDEIYAYKKDVAVYGYVSPVFEAEKELYGRSVVDWANNGKIDQIMFANYTEPISKFREVANELRAEVPQRVKINPCLTTYFGFIKTDEDMYYGALELLCGSVDSLWIYRSTELDDSNLWAAADHVDYVVTKTRDMASRVSANYNASESTGLPTANTPAWTLYGTAMTKYSTYLLQDNTSVPGQQYGYYTSPSTSGLMKLNDATKYGYGIEFRVKPTSDIDATNDSDRYNMCVVWADDTYNYRVAIDKDSDNGGAGTTGGIKCGSVASWQCFVDYNAANVTNQIPNQVTPKWRISGSSSMDSSVWSDQGDYSLMNLDDDGDPVDQGDTVSWISPQTCIDMKKGGHDYKIEVKVQPIGDLVSTGYSYEYAQIAVYWADDANTYSICFDKDTDDGGAGTTGRVARGKYPLVTVFGNVNWSTPRTITIEYSGTTDQFKFYLDGVYQTAVSSASCAVGTSYNDNDSDKVTGRVAIGDYSSGGYDHEARWYSVKVYRKNDDALTGIDWSQPRTIYISYHNDDKTFYFYIDGVLKNYASYTEVKCGSATSPFYDSVSFGDTTTGGNDAAASWYYARVHDLNVPCNADH